MSGGFSALWVVLFGIKIRHTSRGFILYSYCSERMKRPKEVATSSEDKNNPKGRQGWALVPTPWRPLRLRSREFTSRVLYLRVCLWDCSRGWVFVVTSLGLAVLSL